MDEDFKYPSNSLYYSAPSKMIATHVKGKGSMRELDKIWASIGSVKQREVIRAVLLDESAGHKSRLQPHDTGHLHTAISVLEHRLEELDPYSG